MKKVILSLATVLALSGCASVVHIPEPEDAQVVVNTNKEFNTLPSPAGGPVVAAVYGFNDKTGQRKPSEKMANISFAVTQGAEVWVIKALQEVGGGQWFKVVERVGLDNLTKERQIIRQARESVGDNRQLKPMMFAGIIIEGGIIGYDSNTLTGGAGARYLGIGASTQYRQDVVTVTMRATSVQTGEVLLSVSTTKTIISTGSSFTVFKFFDVGTRSLETEVGNSINEPVNYAVRAAIEQAVVEMVKEGNRKGLWSFKKPPEAKVEIIPEVTSKSAAVEVKKNELVQKDTAPKAAEPAAAAPLQPISGEVNGATRPGTDTGTKTHTPVSKEQVTNEVQKKTGKILDWVNIRATQYGPIKSLIKLAPGTEVTVIEQEVWWARVRFNDIEGWIPIQFIKVQQ
jgi:curli production assembly/transport component CsgG